MLNMVAPLTVLKSLNAIYHYKNTAIQMYWKFYPKKNENFQIKNSDIFHISAQNIDCGYSLELPHQGGSNQYPQSMFWADIRKIMYIQVNPVFYYIEKMKFWHSCLPVCPNTITPDKVLYFSTKKYWYFSYRIRSNYRTYPYKRTVKKFRSLQITASALFLYFFIKAYVMVTHLNCIDLSMHFKWAPTTYAIIKKVRKYRIIIIK